MSLGSDFGLGSNYVANVLADATSSSPNPLFQLLLKNTTEGQIAAGCQCVSKAIEMVAGNLRFLQMEELKDLGVELERCVRPVRRSLSTTFLFHVGYSREEKISRNVNAGSGGHGLTSRHQENSGRKLRF
jgi:hypothetical protein